MLKTLELAARKTKLRQESRFWTYIVNGWLIFFAIVSLIPMIWLLLAPSKEDADITNRHPLAFGSFGNYIKAWNNLQFFDNGVMFTWVINSLWYTASIVVIATVTA
jgi:multiple sugar transport system permease protein